MYFTQQLVGLLAAASAVSAQVGIIVYDQPNYQGRTQAYNYASNFRLPFTANR
jgi:hypothetical protein